MGPLKKKKEEEGEEEKSFINHASARKRANQYNSPYGSDKRSFHMRGSLNGAARRYHAPLRRRAGGGGAKFIIDVCDIYTHHNDV